jgi:hypothetical protein
MATVSLTKSLVSSVVKTCCSFAWYWLKIKMKRWQHCLVELSVIDMFFSCSNQCGLGLRYLLDRLVCEGSLKIQNILVNIRKFNHIVCSCIQMFGIQRGLGRIKGKSKKEGFFKEENTMPVAFRASEIIPR